MKSFNEALEALELPIKQLFADADDIEARQRFFLNAFETEINCINFSEIGNFVQALRDKLEILLPGADNLIDTKALIQRLERRAEEARDFIERTKADPRNFSF